MIRDMMNGGGSVEDTLALWASGVRDAKQRIRPLFTLDRVANVACQFLEALLGSEPRKTGWMRAVCFLSSSESGLMTGAVIEYDQSVWGGYDISASPLAPL